MRLGRGLLFDAMVLAAVAGRCNGAGPGARYPRNYRVLVENDPVRVLDFRLRKGDTEETHSHPAHVLYVLEPFADPIRAARWADRGEGGKGGDVLFSEAVTHSPPISETPTPTAS